VTIGCTQRDAAGLDGDGKLEKDGFRKDRHAHGRIGIAATRLMRSATLMFGIINLQTPRSLGCGGGCELNLSNAMARSHRRYLPLFPAHIR
jgi:hypothetical protein